MKLKELADRLEKEKHFTGGLQIELGRRINAAGVLGVFEEVGTWFLYDTNDRSEIVILDSGSEDEMADGLYRRVLKIEKRLLKKMGK